MPTPFTPFTSKVVPLPNENVDTDQIIPARFLKGTDKSGLGENLFADWRFNSDGTPKADFVLSRPEMQGRAVLLAGDNVGCGSSREHAPWALLAYGFRAVVSTSFADIFRNNALKNGLLPIVVDRPTHERLFRLAAENPDVEVGVDLASQTLSLPRLRTSPGHAPWRAREDVALSGGDVVTFPIDPFAKTCLLQGVDELGYLLTLEPAIAAFERRRTVDGGQT